MTKYFCDCCGKEERNITKVKALTLPPCVDSEGLAFEEKDFCKACAVQYAENCARAVYEVWLHMAGKGAIEDDPFFHQ